MTDRYVGLSEPFRLVSLKRCDAPPHMEGINWHRYVISQSGNQIEGFRQGELESVRQATEEMVEQINLRRLGKRGIPQSRPGPKKAT